MFTGLVEEVGVMRSINKQGEAMVLNIHASLIMSDLKIGDSVAVNGVCLTAIAVGNDFFSVDVMPQTFRHSNLYMLQSGNKVNLERAMGANGRFGGHIVQGHADGTGTIRKMAKDQNAVMIVISFTQQELMKYVIPQGSVTIDGISLTVVSTEEDAFTVSIIPHTLSQTSLTYKGPGDAVNIECDIIGKYVDHLLHYRPSGGSAQSQPAGISLELLSQHGFA